MTTRAKPINRVMLLTPPGSAAVAVLRLAGPGVGAFLENHFSRRVSPGQLTHGTLSDADRVIDDPLVSRIEEDVVDVNLHGGAWIVRSAIELAERSGFTRVDRDGQMFDAARELEREVLEWLPQARTELAIRALMAQAAAWETSRRSPKELLEDRSLHWLLNPPRVAIVGAANVGKSTLANQLFAQEHSITADLPGTTRDWVGQIANIDGLAVMLIDTPGLRDTLDPIEAAAIGISRRQIQQADAIILVLDAARALVPEQSALMDEFPDAVKVINRVDLPAAWDLASLDALHTVATTGQGIDALRRAMRRRFDCESADVDLARIWTRRQREIVERARVDLDALREI